MTESEISAEKQHAIVDITTKVSEWVENKMFMKMFFKPLKIQKKMKSWSAGYTSALQN